MSIYKRSVSKVMFLLSFCSRALTRSSTSRWSSLHGKPLHKYQHNWVLEFDGGSRGNPGNAGSGAVIFSDAEGERKELWSGYVYLGQQTNNYAEYMGLILGLKQALDMKLPSLLIRGDSQLVIRQLKREYAVRAVTLKPLFDEATALLSLIPEEFELAHIPRSENSRADELSNLAMDTRRSWGSQPIVLSSATQSKSISSTHYMNLIPSVIIEKAVFVLVSRTVYDGTNRISFLKGIMKPGTDEVVSDIDRDSPFLKKLRLLGFDVGSLTSVAYDSLTPKKASKLKIVDNAIPASEFEYLTYTITLDKSKEIDEKAIKKEILSTEYASDTRQSTGTDSRVSWCLSISPTNPMPLLRVPQPMTVSIADTEDCTDTSASQSAAALSSSLAEDTGDREDFDEKISYVVVSLGDLLEYLEKGQQSTHSRKLRHFLRDIYNV